MASPRLKRTVQGLYFREGRKKERKKVPPERGDWGGNKKAGRLKKLVTGTRPLQTKAG